MEASNSAPWDAGPLSLIVLAHDEAEHVSTALGEILGWLRHNEPGAELIFVDDGSTDDTAMIAEKALAGNNANVVRHPKRRGIGAAIKTGTVAASNPWVTFMPADGQIPPEGIGTLRAAAERTQHPLVLSVYQAREDGSLRKVLSWGVRTLIRLIHGVSLRCEGPYLFRREFFDPELLKPDSFFLNFEFPIRMLRSGHPVSVVKIHCRPRMAGKSKTANLATIVAVTRDLVGLRFRLWRE